MLAKPSPNYASPRELLDAVIELTDTRIAELNDDQAVHTQRIAEFIAHALQIDAKTIIGLARGANPWLLASLKALKVLNTAGVTTDLPEIRSINPEHGPDMLHPQVARALRRRLHFNTQAPVIILDDCSSKPVGERQVDITRQLISTSFGIDPTTIHTHVLSTHKDTSSRASELVQAITLGIWDDAERKIFSEAHHIPNIPIEDGRNATTFRHAVQPYREAFRHAFRHIGELAASQLLQERMVELPDLQTA